MSPAKNSSDKVRFPTKDQDSPFDKGLDGIFALLTSPRSKKATPNCSDETFMKCRTILLGEMATKGSAEDAIALLHLIGKVIYLFSKMINSKLKEEPDVLKIFLENYKEDQGKSLFTVSIPTLTKVLDGFPEKDATRVLNAQIETISGRLAKQGLKPPQQILALDPSDVLYRGKFANQWTPYAYTGQKNLYKRAFKENIFYLDPLQLCCGCTPVPIRGDKRRDQDLVPWISQCQTQIVNANRIGSPIRVILGDREFYSGIGNAFSYLGLWDPTHSPESNPRMVVPKKIWKDAEEKKWAFLLNPKAKILETDEIELDYYDQQYLGADLSRLLHNSKGTRYMVPVASVAVFDNYPNRHKPKTMDWAHTEAKKIETRLLALSKDLADMEQAYIHFLKKNKRKNCGPPSFGKKPRTSFKDPGEKILYNECLRINRQIKRWQTRKEALCKRLMFFTVSLHENETPDGREEEFLQLVGLYHQRWGIEIDVKLIKWEFPITSNCRKSTRRHLNWVISALVENSWHFYRLTRAARNLKVDNPEWKPFHPEFPLKRIKWNRKLSPVLSARGYIMELLEDALKNLIKTAI